MTDVQGRIITVSNDSQAECYHHSACFLKIWFKHESWMERNYKVTVPWQTETFLIKIAGGRT